MYRPWAGRLGGDVRVLSVEIPGRGTRWREPAFRSMAALVDVLANELAPALDRPYAFFGHSMGARIAFELTRELRRRAAPAPAHLIVAGNRGPSVPRREPPMHTMTDAELVGVMRTLGGTPPELLDNREMLDLALPIMRADCELLETAEHRVEPPLATPILALGGVRDPYVTAADLAGWGPETSAKFSALQLDGDHFFVQSHAAEVLARVDEVLGVGAR